MVFGSMFALTPSAMGITVLGSGTISATLDNPIYAAPENSAYATGVGTSKFSWGYLILDPNGQPYPGDSQSSIEFTSGTFSNVAPAEIFTGARLQFHNGSYAGGTGATGIDVNATSSSDDHIPFDFNGQHLHVGLTIVNTLNDGIDPMHDADFVYITDHPEYGSFRVYEGGTTYIDLKFAFGSLIFAGVGDVGDTQSGFLWPTIDIIPNPQLPDPQPVPEPLTVAGGAAALSALGLASARRRKA